MDRTILTYDVVRATNRDPAAWLFVLHGIFGAGRNWGSVARRLVHRRPDWGVLLVDLRQHGGSQGFSPPHTLAAAAADLRDLAAVSQRSPRAILGHSFGGKVALTFAAHPPANLAQVWVVDASPDGGRPAGSAWRMLEVVRSLPASFPNRAVLVTMLQEAGFTGTVARWMATNLADEGGAYRWRFDLSAVEALLRDYFSTDLWPVVEEAPASIEVHFVKADDSSVLGPAALERLQRQTVTGRVFLHQLRGGHWLNADNPEGMLDLLVKGLPAA